MRYIPGEGCRTCLSGFEFLGIGGSEVKNGKQIPCARNSTPSHDPRLCTYYLDRVESDSVVYLGRHGAVESEVGSTTPLLEIM